MSWQPGAPNPGINRRSRPPGAAGKLALEARRRAQETGELPHEFLLRVARGELIQTKILDPITGQIKEVYDAPSLEVRIDAAKACAPYFAPKLQAVELIGKTIGSADDDELDAIIADAAAAAGIAVSLTGEGEEEEDSPRSGVRKLLAHHIRAQLTSS